MMNLVNYVVNHHSNAELVVEQLPKEQAELAKKVNTFFIESKLNKLFLECSEM